MDVLPGQILALAGPSGSGKTTLLNVLGLLRRPDAGSIAIDDVEATRWREPRRRAFWRQHAAFIFQDYGLIDDATVAYNVSIAHRRWYGLPRQHRSRVASALDAVGLADRAAGQTARLSGGEKQRVGLARAAFRAASIVLADEPTASLDRDNREMVTRFLRAEAERGAAVVVATHDEALMAHADAIVRLDQGRLTAPENRED